MQSTKGLLGTITQQQETMSAMEQRLQAVEQKRDSLKDLEPQVKCMQSITPSASCASTALSRTATLCFL